MKTIIIEAASVFALIFIVYRGIFLVLGSRIEATSRETAFYVHSAICGIPFAIAAWLVLPHLTTTLNFYSKGDQWGNLIMYGGGYLVLMMGAGLTALVIAYTVFKIITKEKSIWELIKTGNVSITYLLSGIIITSSIMVAVLAGEIAKWMIPFSSVPFNY